MSTTLLIGRTPQRARRIRIQSGLGPRRTFVNTRAVYRGHSAASTTWTTASEEEPVEREA